MPAVQPSPSPARKTRKSRRPSVDDRLLAAMERLLEQGNAFANVTVEQLAEEAGIARATFYLHFHDKAELVAHLLRRVTSELLESGGEWFREGSPVNRQSMQFAIRGGVTTLKKHQAIIAAVSDTSRTDATVAALHQELLDALIAVSRRAVDQVRRSGLEAPGAPDDLATVLARFIEQYCARYVSEYEGKALDGLIDTLSYICGNAIFGSEPAQGRN